MLCRLGAHGHDLIKSHRQIYRSISTKVQWTRKKRVMTTGGLVTGAAAGALIFALDRSVKASDIELHPPKNPWSHNGWFHSLDHASIRRGFEVYKNLCSACHSLRFIAYRHLVGVSHSEEEAKAEAAQQTIVDGPDENGEMFERPGKLSDHVPCPYPNEEAARAANNGSFPPDLSYILLARHGQEDYVFSLLTGYCDPPAGVLIRDGQYYNPYFLGGAISMGQIIFNESLEFSDGTPASASQIAKDLCVFLKWTGEPEFDARKNMMVKTFVVIGFLAAVAYYVHKFKWSVLKTRKIVFNPSKKK